MAKKKDNGEGSISKYKGGYRASIRLGRDAQGKQVRKEFYGKTKKEVKDKLTEFKKEYLKGNIDVSNNFTVAEWYITWLEEYQKKNVKPRTYLRYEGLYRNYIKGSSLAKVKLTNLKVTHLRKYYNQLIEAGASNSVINTLNAKLKTCLAEAERQELISKNPAKIITLKSDDHKREVQILSVEDQARFLEYLEVNNHKHKMLFTLALASGLRLGELLGLKWEDINFEKGELSVKRSLQKIKNNEGKWVQVEQTPKTVNSIRVVPIPANVLKELKQHKIEQNKTILLVGDAYTNNNYVFCNDLGAPLDDKTPGRNMTTILKHLDIEYIKFHALRHTFITRMFEAGVDAKTIAELVGHSDVSTTLNIYTHVSTNEKVKAISKIDNIFAKKS